MAGKESKIAETEKYQRVDQWHSQEARERIEMIERLRLREYVQQVVWAEEDLAQTTQPTYDENQNLEKKGGE